MKKVIVKNKQGNQTHGATLENPSEWIADCVKNNWWGKPERWVREGEEDISQAIETREVELEPAIPAVTEMQEVTIPPVLDEEGNELEPQRTEMQEVEVTPAIPAVTVTEYKLAAEYTIEIEDITAEIEAEKQELEEIKKAKKRLRALKAKDKIAGANNMAALRSTLQEILPDLITLLRK